MSSLARSLADIINLNGEVKASAIGDIGLTVYSTLDDLPFTGLTEGDQAYVSSNRRFYISNGSGWYNVALANASPNLTVSNGAVVLATDGSTPTVITLTATDSDNPLAAITYTVESDGSFGGLATLSQDSSVFTITPLSEDSATTTSSTLTFKASDGINFGTDISSFSLTFGPDWSVAPTETKLYADQPGASEQLGYFKRLAVSGDGNYIAAGAPGDDGDNDAGPNQQGAVNIFVKSGGTWSLQQVIRRDVAAAALGEGLSLDETGTYLLIGANTEGSTGKAHIYKRTGSTWAYMQTLVASDGGSGDNFGMACSISKDGTVAAICAREYDGVSDGTSNSGAVYTFSKSGETWTQTAIVESASPAVNEYFGTGVALSEDGTYMIVGAWGTNTFNGSVVLFSWNGTSWDLDQTIAGPSGTGRLGFDVDISNDGVYAISGAYLNTPDQAYIWVRSGSTWTQQALLTASDAQSDDNFGVSVAISGDGNYCIAGAMYEDEGGFNAGAAYIFERNGTTWTEVKKLIASDAQADEWFGQASRINYNGTVAVCAASRVTGPGSEVNAGALYVYEA